VRAHPRCCRVARSQSRWRRSSWCSPLQRLGLGLGYDRGVRDVRLDLPHSPFPLPECFLIPNQVDGPAADTTLEEQPRVTCCTGKFAGFSPLSTRPIYVPSTRPASLVFVP